jgi:hypothetical protein
MCGPETSNRPRGGALAALCSLDAAGHATTCGDLAFHTPGLPESNEATHVRLMPDAAYDARTLADLSVVIQCVTSLHSKQIPLLHTRTGFRAAAANVAQLKR